MNFHVYTGEPAQIAKDMCINCTTVHLLRDSCESKRLSEVIIAQILIHYKCRKCCACIHCIYVQYSNYTIHNSYGKTVESG